MNIPTLGDAPLEAAEIPSSRGTSRSSSFSQLSLTRSVSTDATSLGDVPIVETMILSGCGTSQSAASSQASLITSLSLDPARLSHAPIPATSIQSNDGIAQQSASPSQPMLDRPASRDPATSAEAPITTSQSSPTSHPSLTMPLSTDTVTSSQAPIVATGITSSHGNPQLEPPSLSQPSPTTSPSTDTAASPPYATLVTTAISYSHETPQSASPSQTSVATLPSLSTEVATLAHGPVVSILSDGTSSALQAPLTTSLLTDLLPPANVLSKVAPLGVTLHANVVRNPDLDSSISTLNVTVTSLPEKTSLRNTLAEVRDAGSGGNARGQPNVTNLKLGGGTTTKPERDTKPALLQAQGKPPAQRQAAGWWFQGSIWRR